MMPSRGFEAPPRAAAVPARGRTRAGDARHYAALDLGTNNCRLLIARPQDAWLATWSRAEAAVTLPVEPVEFASSLAALLRQRRLQSA